MPSFRPTVPSVLAASLLLAGAVLAPRLVPAVSPVVTALAQDAEAPAAEAPASETPAAKPKPKPKPRPKAEPKPKPEPKTEPKPEAKPEPKPEPEQKATEKPAAETPVLAPGAPEARAVWPNGARSVSESYGDWTMNCNRENGGKVDCVVIQSQGDRRTGRRQFSVELRTPREGRTEGLILMPFGLQIEPGVTFKLDDRTLGKGAPYSYCVNDGCLVPISLPALATDAMKTAQSLVISATKADAKEPPTVTVPLAGFAAAFSRATAFADQ